MIKNKNSNFFTSLKGLIIGTDIACSIVIAILFVIKSYIIKRPSAAHSGAAVLSMATIMIFYLLIYYCINYIVLIKSGKYKMNVFIFLLGFIPPVLSVVIYFIYISDIWRVIF